METHSNSIVPTGIWANYSGAEFEVIGVASGTAAPVGEVVVYRGLRSGHLYYRPLNDFLNTEPRNDVDVPKFTYVREA